MALTKILDKLVQIGPGYLDQTLRTYIAENREYRFYTDTANNKSYAVVAYYSSGELVLNETKTVDMLVVAGGGGSTLGNLSGGSGAGEVVVVENATLRNGHYVIEVGAGGAGGYTTQADAVDLPLTELTVAGSNGIESKFYLKNSAGTQLIATGGGVGGYRSNPQNAVVGGSGGGAGGADYDSSNGGFLPNQAFSEGAITSSVVTTGTNIDLVVDNSVAYLTGNTTNYLNNGGYSDPVQDDPSYTRASVESYHAGGGGGAGTAGGSGNINKAGDGGDGVSINWVNEVFREVYKFNSEDRNDEIYWGAGGGGASTSDEEPGNGGKGGGGGGASSRTVDFDGSQADTDEKRYRNGKGGKYGISNGHDGGKLKGGAGAKNTGSGAGGSMFLAATNSAYQELLQGNNGGSGFVLIRIHLDEVFSPYSASL